MSIQSTQHQSPKEALQLPAWPHSTQRKVEQAFVLSAPTLSSVRLHLQFLKPIPLEKNHHYYSLKHDMIL